jgi:hypothetical protein
MLETQTKLDFPLSKPPSHRAQCKVCAAAAELFDVVDFNKHCSEEPYSFGLSGVPVYYYRCMNCNLIFTTFFDNWTQAQFKNFIYNADYVKIDGDYIEKRPDETAAKLGPLLREGPNLAILDYGSGSGAFTERLRDRYGVTDVESYDPFSSPVRPSRKFDIITCIEVIEHCPFPLVTLAEIISYLKQTGLILIGTALQPEDISRTRAAWWYIGPRNGHVTVFNDISLLKLAEQSGLLLYLGDGLHCLKFSGAAQAASPAIFGAARPFFHHKLSAPPQLLSDVSRRRWHDVENGSVGSYRWTSSPELLWRVPLMPNSHVRIEVPFTMEIEPGFAERSAFVVADHAYPVRILQGPGYLRLVGDIEVSKIASNEVVLRTPGPKAPHDLRESPDMRHLGLAVLVA